MSTSGMMRFIVAIPHDKLGKSPGGRKQEGFLSGTNYLPLENKNMLPQETIKIVKSTAPLLAEEGENITRLFYQKLFSQHPELNNVFNLTNQAKGDQARALADSVFAYASRIDQLDKLGPMVSRIAHKHASLQVSPEQYPIVGKYLLEAIRDHLKLNPDDPVLQAWSEAYQALADIFISSEEAIYQSNEVKPGGWRGFRAFVIAAIKKETDDVYSFCLAPADGLPIAGFQPGQFIGIKTHPETSDYDEIRQYSLSNRPGENHYRITVKAESPGTSTAGHVSNHLCKSKVGDQVLLQPPTGDFVVSRENADLVLVGGGIGITPLLSILLDRVHRNVDVDKVVFIHCCRDESHHVMQEELRSLSARTGFSYYVAYERDDGADHVGYLNTEILEKWLSHNAAQDVYFCGPTPFMAALHMLLSRMGYAENQLHYEIFGPRIRFSDSH
jgi:nitric oxide dioxygenase